MSCVYRYIDGQGAVVYVGKTNDLDSRHLHHINKSDKNHEILINCSLEYIGGLSAADADILETYFISKYRPRLNEAKQWGDSSVKIRTVPPWEPVQFPHKTRMAIDAIQKRRPRCRRCKKPLTMDDLRYIENYDSDNNFSVKWYLSLCPDCISTEEERVLITVMGDDEDLKSIEEEDERYRWRPPPPEQLRYLYKEQMGPMGEEEKALFGGRDPRNFGAIIKKIGFDPWTDEAAAGNSTGKRNPGTGCRRI